VGNANSATCASATCSIIYEDTVNLKTYVQVEQTCGSSGCSAGETVAVTVTSLVNPSLLTANYPTTSFEIYTLNANGFKVDGYSTDIHA
jgi:hypothetical protein